MTSQEWQASDSPDRMLRHLAELDAGVAHDPGRPRRHLAIRKLRLLACAYCRHVWHLLTDERARRAVEVAERFADGEATEVELEQAAFDPRRLPHRVPDDCPALASLRAALACSRALTPDPYRIARARRQSQTGPPLTPGLNTAC
jgi:hypothetical protein